MLSRVADSLFWMNRYIERAENAARIIDVNLQLLLDFQKIDDAKLKEHWDPIIKATGDEKLFYKLYTVADSTTVTEFLTFQDKNPNSIVSSISLARENARAVRAQLSTEMWEEINRIYLFLKGKSGKRMLQQDPYEFFKHIKEGSLLIQGMTESTIPHDQGWEFIQIGKYLERADKTTRILDVKYHILLPNVKDVGGAVDAVQWSAVLRSCSGHEAYHQAYVDYANPWKVAEFLILSEEFPRSIRFCVGKIDQALRRISGSEENHFANDAEKFSGRLLSDLNFSSIDDIFRVGLHEYLDKLQLSFNEIGRALYLNYFFYPETDLAKEIQHQQQQQQQAAISRRAELVAR